MSQLTAVVDAPVRAALEVVGLALLAAVLASLVALAYRWYAKQRVQTGLPVLVGLSGVALYRNTSTALGQVISDSGADPLAPDVAAFNVVIFAVATVAAVAGIRLGDHLGVSLFAATGGRDFEGEVSRVVEAVGRVIAVELPEDIEDVVGYDPVPDETKAQLAGRTFLFPKRLTVGELESRLAARLRDDYGVGHVDVDLAPDGSVEYLAVATRAAGIGPTLPPETAAVAVRADPAFAASAGDVVQVWRGDPPERVTTAELRGVAGDTVTLAVDAADVDALDPERTYRLVTLPVESRPDREFASLLRAAEETMGVVDVAADSSLVGQPVGALDAAVVAVRGTDGDVETIPSRARTLAAGEAVYAIARPDTLRKLEAAGGASAARQSAAGSDDD